MPRNIASALRMREGYRYRDTIFHTSDVGSTSRSIIFAEKRTAADLGSVVADCIVFANVNDARVALIAPVRSADDFSCAVVSRFSGHDEVMGLFESIKKSRYRLPSKRECMDVGYQVFAGSVSQSSPENSIRGALELSRRLGCLRFRGWPVLLEDLRIRDSAYLAITAVNPQLTVKQNMAEYHRQVREARQHGNVLKRYLDFSTLVALE